MKIEEKKTQVELMNELLQQYESRMNPSDFEAFKWAFEIGVQFANENADWHWLDAKPKKMPWIDEYVYVRLSSGHYTWTRFNGDTWDCEDEHLGKVVAWFKLPKMERGEY